jgi:hypothetical protein
MAEEPSYAVELVLGLCDFLGRTGVGFYDPEGYPPSYDEDLPAIVPQSFPPTPRALIGVTLYGDVRSPEHPVARQLIQIKTRTPARDPLAGTALVDAIKRRLHERTYLQLGRVRLSRIRRESFAYLGPSPTDGAPEYTSAYSFQGLEWLLPAAPRIP